MTGGSSGLGEAVVYRLAEEGASVAVGGRDAARTHVGRRAAAPAPSSGHASRLCGRPRRHRVVADCERLVAETVARFGRLDILVNSAGVWLEKPILDTSEADWEWCSASASRAPTSCAKAALRHMVPRHSGVIVNIASDSGIHGEPGAAVYSAAKAGVVMMTRALAIDHGPDGIRVSSVSPATFDTPMVARPLPRRRPGGIRRWRRMPTRSSLRSARGAGRRRRLPCLRRGELRERPDAGHRWRSDRLTRPVTLAGKKSASGAWAGSSRD